MIRRSQTLVLVAALALLSSSAFGECAKPEAQPIVEKLTGRDYFPGLEALYFDPSPENKGPTWLLGNWYAPGSGVLVAITCDGKPLGGLEIGFGEKIEAVHIDGVSDPAVLVEYIVAHGTSGFMYKRVGIFKLLDGKVSELWSHDSFARGFEAFCDPIGETRYDISVSTNGKRVNAIGKKTTIFRKVVDSQCVVESSSDERMPMEVVCWNGKDAYIQCQ